MEESVVLVGTWVLHSEDLIQKEDEKSRHMEETAGVVDYDYSVNMYP